MSSSDKKTFTVADISSDAMQMIEVMKNDLLLIMVARLGKQGEVKIPVSEIDEFPKGKGLAMQLVQGEDGPAFIFKVLDRDPAEKAN